MNSPIKQNRRKTYYVDHKVQKYLLVALVVMEVLLAGAGIWALYHALGEIVEADIYRVHLTQKSPLLPVLINEGMRVLGAMLLVNLLALFIADRIWALYVNRILQDLDDLMHAAKRLDFSKQSRGSCDHAVLHHAVHWRRGEAARFQNVREIVQGLPPSLPATHDKRNEFAAVLLTLLDK